MDVLLTLPLGIFSLVHSVNTEELTPWPGWNEVHSDFWFVGQLPTALWSSDYWLEFSLRWNQWASVFCAFVFFAFFGFAQDVREGYWKIYVRLMKKLGIQIDDGKETVLPPIDFIEGQRGKPQRYASTLASLARRALRQTLITGPEQC